MSNGRTVPLGEVASFVGGGTPSRERPEFFEGSICWATSKDMKSEYLDDTQEHITPAAVEQSATKLVPPGTILVVVKSKVLMHSLPVAISRVPTCFGQDLKGIRVSDSHDVRYVAHALRAGKHWLLERARGVNTEGLTLEHLKEFPLPFRPLARQRRIAEILDRAESLRNKRQSAIRLLDKLILATFLDLFGASTQESWEMATVADVAAPGPGSIRTGPFGSQLLHGEFTDEGIGVLGIDNAVANEFRWAERRFITERKFQELKRYQVFPGDVIITIMGTCGRCAIIPNHIEPAISSKHLCCITLDNRKCLPVFLQAYFLHHPAARQYLAQKSKGAIMAGLNMEIIKGLPVPYAPIALQEYFGRRIAAIERTKRLQRTSLALLDELFSSLQHQAFRGEL